MIVLGLDPGLERVGYAFIRREGSRLEALDIGLIETPRIELADRLGLIYEKLCVLIDANHPDAAAIERLLFSVNKTTAMDVAKASGVLMLACRQAGLSVSEITPPEVKQAVVGYGSADKKQVQFMVTKLLGLKEVPKPDDVADACAVAIAYAMRVPAANSIQAAIRLKKR